MPRPANPESRRRLLDAGLQLLLRDGFAGAGVQEIAQLAEVPKGSFYSYFASKESFAAEVLDQYWTPIESELFPLLRDEATPPTQRILNFFRALANEHEAHEFVLGCLIGRLSLELAGSSDSTRDRLADIFARWDGAIAQCLRDGHSASKLSPASANALAADIVGAWEGAALRGKVSRSRIPYDRFETVVLPALLTANAGPVGA